MTPQVVDPSHDLKQRTIANVERVKKQVQRENKARNRLHHSQLLKGSLKTLGRPMTASGPRIRSCQGIVAGKPVYDVSTFRKAQNDTMKDSNHMKASNLCSSILYPVRPPFMKMVIKDV